MDIEIKEPAVDYNKMKYTIEEYLEKERASDTKHEYYQGEIFAMAGTSTPHNVISVNLITSIKNSLKGKACRPYGSDFRIHIPQNSLFTYPDISIVCGEITTRENDNENLLNPIVIIEILSPSTRSYDKGKKFSLYKHIPTLKEYILVDSQALKIEAWFITSGSIWELKEYQDKEEQLHIQTIDVQIPLTDIYEDTGLTVG
jgi:Uma2 family endonuclease